MSYVIFSIDRENDAFAMNAFKNYIADIQRKVVVSNLIPLIGSYKGTLENSFIWNVDDFNTHIRDTIYIKDQESILHVASGNKMEATLEFLSDGSEEFIGCMHVVCEAEAMSSEAWTKRLDMSTYWVAKHGNPDDSYNKSLKEYGQ